MKELDPTTVESSELVQETFNYWYSDHGHIRSPFPLYIQSQLKQQATKRFFDWASGLNEKAKEEVNDILIGEKFEEIIFETASKLVKTEDERITILYPFMPRRGDKINNDVETNGNVESEVVDRAIDREEDTSFLRVKLKSLLGNHTWETKFELPV